MTLTRAHNRDTVPLTIVSWLLQSTWSILHFKALNPCLKLSKILSLFKSGSPQETSNYRPISLLSLFKNSRLIDYLNKDNILNKYQFGFRKDHSTTLALNIENIDNLSNCVN